MRRHPSGGTAQRGTAAELASANGVTVDDDLPRLRRKLLAYALRETRNADAAEDATQETMLAVLVGPERHRTGIRRDIYAVGVLRHKIADHFRARKREMPMEPEALDMLREQRSGPVEANASPWEAGERIDAKRESVRFWRALRSCLDSLPETTRSAFVLRDLKEWDMADVCRHLGVTATHVSVMTHRARAHVRARWPAAVQGA